MTNTSAPPKALGAARVLSYAVVDSCAFQGSSLFVDGVPLGPVPCLAVTQAFGTAEVALLRCNVEWRFLGVSAHESVEAARACAEREYPGSSALWRDISYSEQESKGFREESWGDLRCSFCGRSPDHFEALVSSASGASICNECLAELGAAST
jgi:hypothetical protein